VCKVLLPVLLIAISLAGSSCGSKGGTGSASGSENIVAVVNDSKIYIQDVDRAIAQQYRGQENQFSQLEWAANRLQALNTLITQEVLYQRAQKENIAPNDEEIRQYIQRTKQENSLTEEAFAEELKRTNQTEEQYREFVKKQVAIQKLYEKTESQLKVKDNEVTDFYNLDPKRFTIKAGVLISDIVIDPRPNGTKLDAVGEAAAEQRVRDVQSRLKRGDDFATLARQFSEHESFQRSGDLGFLAKDAFQNLPQVMGLPASLGDRFMSMSEGNITEPIRDSVGRWHVFKLTGKQMEPRDRTLEDPNVKKEISDLILSQRKEIVAAAVQTRARDEAKIENLLAQRMLENPNSLGVLRPISAATTNPSPQSTPAP
jgi:parvulin-like peptidyl-prolyl isomerase